MRRDKRRARFGAAWVMRPASLRVWYRMYPKVLRWFILDEAAS